MLHFLYLTNTRLVSIRAQGRRLVARREFAVSGVGASEFERYMSELEPVPTLNTPDFRRCSKNQMFTSTTSPT